MSAASSYCRRRLAVHIAAGSFMNAYVYVHACVCVSISPGLRFMLDIIFIIAFAVVRGGAA